MVPARGSSLIPNSTLSLILSACDTVSSLFSALKENLASYFTKKIVIIQGIKALSGNIYVNTYPSSFLPASEGAPPTPDPLRQTTCLYLQFSFSICFSPST